MDKDKPSAELDELKKDLSTSFYLLTAFYAKVKKEKLRDLEATMRSHLKTYNRRQKTMYGEYLSKKAFELLQDCVYRDENEKAFQLYRLLGRMQQLAGIDDDWVASAKSIVEQPNWRRAYKSQRKTSALIRELDDLDEKFRQIVSDMAERKE